MVQPAVRSRPFNSVSPEENAASTFDGESCGWLAGLSDAGPTRDATIERLHALLLRAARFEVARRQRAVSASGGGSSDLDDLAMHAADDALVAILRKLHTYRGDSRFTTWAYKFALLEAAVKVRRRPWHGREVPLEADGWDQLLDDRRATPDGQAEASELIGAVRDAIAEVLTPHQRSVLVAITLNDVPIDVLAERRGTTRGALYKTLHDARRKLRARLAQDGLAIDAIHGTRAGGSACRAPRVEGPAVERGKGSGAGDANRI
jgi:RNA polymerase sigma-70 factor (ECF subfamily)